MKTTFEADIPAQVIVYDVGTEHVQCLECGQEQYCPLDAAKGVALVGDPPLFEHDRVLLEVRLVAFAKAHGPCVVRALAYPEVDPLAASDYAADPDGRPDGLPPVGEAVT